jgi:hypothetical protein
MTIMKKLALLLMISSLVLGTSCIEDLLDPDLKELEPYMATWNIQSVHAYTLYTPAGADPTRSQERDFKNVTGTFKLQKDKDTDNDSYRTGSYDISFTAIDIHGNEYEVTATDNFIWDVHGDNGSLYVELDDSDGETLGISTVSIDFLWKVELTDDSYTFGLTIGSDGYTSEVAEFTCTK